MAFNGLSYNPGTKETPESQETLHVVIAPDSIGHASAGDRDFEGFRQSILHFHNLFAYEPDSFVVEDQFVEGDKVATRMTARVKVRATGEPITLIGINLAKIVGGKIVEEWNTWERLQAPQG